MKTVLMRLLLIFATLFIPAVAQNSSRAVIIFDASGSMWGQIDGKPKITIAKEALKKVVNGWNPNIELGLTVYGHRRKGDCSDIERVVPIGKVNKAQIINAVEHISPKGKTPIAKSITQVANELRANEDESTIILISDGKESCGANPCEVAKQLKKEGINFVTHVIGFNVDKSTSKQLECIANATGGEYFSAKNADALNKAMKTIVKKVEVTKPKKLEKNIQITASETKDGKFVNALHQIYKDIGGKRADRYEHLCESSKKEPCLESVPAGKYIIVTQYNKYKVNTPVEVSDTNLTKVNVITGQTGEAKIFASETEGGKWVRSYHYIYSKAKDKNIDSCGSSVKKPCLKRLPVGEYIAKSSYSQFKKETPFVVKADATVDVPVVFSQTGKVFVSASEKEGGKWINADCNIYSKDDDKSYIVYPRKKESSMSYEQLPVGKYTLNCTYNAFEKKGIPFEIKPGETTKVHVVMGQTGKVFVSASEKEGGKWIDADCNIYSKDDDKSYVVYPRKKESSMSYSQIPIGEYTLKCSYNAFEKETTFKVKPGETTKVHVVMGQTGKVFVSASEKEGGKWINANCNIYSKDDDKSYIVYPRKQESSMSYEQLPVGKYKLSCTYKSFKKQTNFEVKPGETTKVHIVFAPIHILAIGTNLCTQVHFEVISARGQVIAEADAPAGKGVEFVIPDGNYTIEATLGEVTKKSKITMPTSKATVDFGGKSTKGGVEGVWDTSEGKATLHLNGTKVHGSYTSDNGEIVGEMTYPQRLEGYWIEDSSNTKCSEAKNGRYYWGKIVWEFSNDMCSFKGKWSYCNNKPDSSWRGKFIKPLPKEPNKEELIKADSPTVTTVTPTKVEPQKSNELDDATKKIEEMKKAINEHKDELKKAGELIKAINGMFNQSNQKQAPSTDKDIKRMSDDMKMLTD